MRSVRFGMFLGGMVGVSLALVFAAWDWIENPGDIFRGPTGTNWPIVFETAMSWLIPTFLIVSVTAAAVHFSLQRLRKRADR